MWSPIQFCKKNKYGFKGIKLEKDQIIKIGCYVYKVSDISTQPKISDVSYNGTEMDHDQENASRDLMTEGLKMYREYNTEEKLKYSQDKYN